MQKKNLKYLATIGLISIFLVGEVFQAGANATKSYYSIPIIEQFYINKAEIAPDEYNVEVGEEFKIYWEITWGDNPEDKRFLYINYGNASGMVNITDRLDEGFVYHSFAMEGKNMITLHATNMLNLTSANITVNVVNSPPEFDFAFFTEDSVNNAHYNFEQNEIPPGEWTTQLSSVIDSGSIHNNVLYLQDNSQTAEAFAFTSFSAQSQGSIEFWAYNQFEIHDGWQGNSQLIIDFKNSGDVGFEVLIDVGENQDPALYSKSEEGLYELDDSFEIYQQWNHFKIRFDCDNGYVSRFSVYLNEELVGNNIPFNISQISIDSLEFSTGIGKRGGWYIDSIAYSWDEGYSIGDNFDTDIAIEDQEVLLGPIRVFDHTTDIGSLNYTWNFGTMDSKNEKNIVYSWEKQGIYSVSLMVMDKEHAFDIKYKNITIINSAPIPYFNYGVDSDATHDFTNSIPGEAPLNWLTNIQGEACSLQVVKWKDTRIDVVEFNHTDAEHTLNTIVMEWRETDTEIWFGTIEFWVYLEDAEQEFYFYMSSGSYYDVGDIENADLVLRIAENKWQRKEKTGGYPVYDFVNMEELGPVDSNTWYHMRVDFQTFAHAEQGPFNYNGLQDQTFRVFIDGQPSNLYDFEGSIYFTNFGFCTSQESLYDTDNYQAYIDSIGVSWDFNYKIGDNLANYIKSYKGTQDFRTIREGVLPNTLWTHEIPVGSSAYIIEALDHHKNVFLMNDTSADEKITSSLYLPKEPSHGTIEFWIRTDQIGSDTTLSLGDSFPVIEFNTNNLGIWYYSDEFNYYPLQDLPALQSNAWTHLRIDFECGTDGYLGLERGYCFFTVDGIQSAIHIPMRDNQGKISRFSLATGQNSIQSLFLDAIGLSWDGSYSIGDNLDLSLGFFDKTQITFSAEPTIDVPSDIPSLRYYWNYGDGHIGYGKNVEHEYLESGRYNVTLYVKDDNGCVRHFSEEIIIDNAPPDLKILPPFHKATYNFQDDVIGEIPADWGLYCNFSLGDFQYGISNYTLSRIIEELDGHRNVLEFNDLGTSDESAVLGIGEYPIIIDENYNILSNPNAYLAPYGTVEFWAYFTDPDKAFYFSLSQIDMLFFRDGAFFKVENGKLYYLVSLYSNWIEVSELGTISANTWHHFRIDFSCENIGYMGLGEDQCRVALNGRFSGNYNMIVQNWTAIFAYLDDIVDDIDFNGPCPIDGLDTIDLLGFNTDARYAYYQVYIDAVGYSWDPNYNIGDNIPEIDYNPYVIYEGQTLLLDTISTDTITDWAHLQYYWDIDGLATSDLGWTFSNQWSDDWQGQISALIEDPDGSLDHDSTNVIVKNMDPHINLEYFNITSDYFAPINISLDISGPRSKSATFCIDLRANNESVQKFYVTKPRGVVRIQGEIIELNLDLTKNWSIVVNYSDMPYCGMFWTYLKIQLPGYIPEDENKNHCHRWWRNWLCKLFPNSPWCNRDPNSIVLTHIFSNFLWFSDPWQIDLEEYLDKVQIIEDLSYILKGSIFDPSTDDIILNTDFISESVVKLNYTDSLIDFTSSNNTLYSFESDSIGDIPDGWVDSIEGVPLQFLSNRTHVVYEFGRGNIVEIEDDNRGALSGLAQFFGSQTKGTVKFWLKSSKVTSAQSEEEPIAAAVLGLLTQEGLIQGFYIGIQNGQIVALRTDFNGYTTTVPIMDVAPNRWYSFELDFEGTHSQYKNLPKGMGRITINGQQTFELPLGKYIEHVIPFNFMGFITGPNEFGYKVSLDNIEFNWPTLKLSPTNTATYNFSTDVAGTIPTGWLDYYPYDLPASSPENSVFIIDEFEGHENVVLLNDTNNDTSCILVNEFANQTSGSLEFWVYLSNTTLYECEEPVLITALATWNGSMSVIGGGLIVGNGYFYIGTGPYDLQIINFAVPNRWYHCRMDFEFTEEGYLGLAPMQYRATIDTHYSLVSNLTQANLDTHQYANLMGFVTSDRGANFTYYIDDVGYSWDAEYTLGENVGIEQLHNSISKTFTVLANPYNITCIVDFWEDEGQMFAKMTAIKPIMESTYENNTFPVDREFSLDIPAQSINFTSILTDNLGFENLILTPLVTQEYIGLRATDDNGGEDVWVAPYSADSLSQVQLSPQVELFYLPEGGEEDAQISVILNITNSMSDQNLSISWNFGDDSERYQGYWLNDTLYYGSHIYERAGTYLCTAYIDNGYSITKKGYLITIQNVAPMVKMTNLANFTWEDQVTSLEAKIWDSPSDGEELRYYWEFGDGTRAYELNPSHSWRDSGYYNITVYVIDDDGSISNYTSSIYVDNFAPVIEGPLSLQGIEGNTLILDISFYNSFLDEYYELTHTWEVYDAAGTLLFTSAERKPSLNLDDGEYYALLTVSDNSGATSTANITISIENVPPVGYVPSEFYYGAPGELELAAYGLDSAFDQEELTFEWYVHNTLISTDYDVSRSTAVVFCNGTGTLSGKVKIIDPAGAFSYAPFQVIKYMDSNGNGKTDEEFSYGFTDDFDKDGLLDYFETPEYIKGADPLKYDTDGDGLADGINYTEWVGEWVLGTSINDSDTDDDTLLDGPEYFGWTISVKQIVGGEFQAILVSSNPLVVDTDGDGLADDNEFANGTNPDNPDTDLDGILDPDEYVYGTDPKSCDTDNDGLTDYQEIFGVNMRWGTICTNATVQDTDSDGLTDYEEYHGLKTYLPTNPLLKDTDGDALLDASESFSQARTLGMRAQIENKGLSKVQSFTMYYPQIEKAQSAQLTVSINAGEGVPAQNLTYAIYLNGVYLNSSMPIYNQSYHTTIYDMQSLVESKHAAGYGGYWEIKVAANYKCLLEQFSLEAAGYLDPLTADTDGDGISDGIEVDPEQNRGWSTDPFSADTDGDGWSDYKEIYQKNTNPLLTDSDADGVLDPRDIAPLDDIIVKVEIKEAHMAGTFLLSPQLQVTLEDKATKNAIYSTREKANHDKKGIDLNDDGDYNDPFESSWYSTADWEDDEDEFYFDVDDDDRSFKLRGRVYLGVFGEYSDLAAKLFDKTFDYDPAKGSKTNWKKEDGNGDWLELSFYTLHIPRVNTIAVYANGTYSKAYGRYYTAEKMVLLNLDVDDASGIWAKGSNVIVLPKSAFVNTELNSLIQQSVDANGNVDWSKMPSALKSKTQITGLDRTNAGKDTSEWLELLITKDDCSVSDAEAILTLLRTGIINETTNETGAIHEVSTGFAAVLMNLPSDILELIPLKDMGWRNDDQGSKPQELDEFVSHMIALVLERLAAIGNFLAGLVEAAVKAGLKFKALIQEAIMAFIEPLLKAALLAYIYFMFGLALYNEINGFILLVGILTPIALLSNSYINIGFLNLEVDLFGVGFKVSTDFKWKYDEFLDLEIPLTISRTYLNNELLYEDVKGILTDDIIGSDIIPEFSPHLENPYHTLIDETTQKYRFSVSYRDDDGYAPADTYPELRIYKNGASYNFYPMEPAEDLTGANFTKGVIYQAEVELLEEGQYSYDISVISKNNVGNSTIELIGPYIEEDVGPVLKHSSTSPEIGFAFETFFNFTVEYKDPQGHKPDDEKFLLKIYKKGVTKNEPKEYFMTPVENSDLDYEEGVIFYNDSVWFKENGEYVYDIEGYDSNSKKVMIEDIEGPTILPSFEDIFVGVGRGINTIFSIATIGFSVISSAKTEAQAKGGLYGIVGLLGGFIGWQVLTKDPDSVWTLIFAGFTCLYVYSVLETAIGKGEVYKQTLESLKWKKLVYMFSMLGILGTIFGYVGESLTDLLGQFKNIADIAIQGFSSLLGYFAFNFFAGEYVAKVFGGKTGKKPEVDPTIKLAFFKAMDVIRYISIGLFILGVYKLIITYIMPLVEYNNG